MKRFSGGNATSKKAPADTISRFGVDAEDEDGPVVVDNEALREALIADLERGSALGLGAKAGDASAGASAHNLDWMYGEGEKPEDVAEEYLTGKRAVSESDLGSEFNALKVLGDRLANVAGATFLSKSTNVRNEAFAVAKGDPMYALRAKEAAMKQALLANPGLRERMVALAHQRAGSGTTSLPLTKDVASTAHETHSAASNTRHPMERNDGQPSHHHRSSHSPRHRNCRSRSGHRGDRDDDLDVGEGRRRHERDTSRRRDDSSRDHRDDSSNLRRHRDDASRSHEGRRGERREASHHRSDRPSRSPPRTATSEESKPHSGERAHGRHRSRSRSQSPTREHGTRASGQTSIVTREDTYARSRPIAKSRSPHRSRSRSHSPSRREGNHRSRSRRQSHTSHHRDSRLGSPSASPHRHVSHTHGNGTGTGTTDRGAVDRDRGSRGASHKDHHYHHHDDDRSRRVSVAPARIPAEGDVTDTTHVKRPGYGLQKRGGRDDALPSRDSEASKPKARSLGPDADMVAKRTAALLTLSSATASACTGIPQSHPLTGEEKAARLAAMSADAERYEAASRRRLEEARVRRAEEEKIDALELQARAAKLARTSVSFGKGVPQPAFLSRMDDKLEDNIGRSRYGNGGKTGVGE